MSGEGSAADAAARIREAFPGQDYVAFHAPRYVAVLELLAPLVGDGRPRVLDIGNSALTALIASRFDVPVDNLGLDGDFPTPHGRSHWYDLNHAQDADRWRTDLDPYDIVVMAEVIEHLHTAPQRVLAFLATLVVPGGVLIIQTPNAAALHNRLELLAGRNPYELIREDTENPGHFREYTRAELLGLARDAGFVVEHWSAQSYFDYRFYPGSPRLRRIGGLVNRCFRILPPTLRPGQTAVLRRP